MKITAKIKPVIKITAKIKELQMPLNGGFEEGFEQGYEKGEKEGYTNGYKTGVTDGTEAGYTKGKTEILQGIDSLYYFFASNSRMKLLPIIMEMDLSNIKNWQYVFIDNTMITEFHAPATMYANLPHGMFLRCTSLVTVSGLDKAVYGQVMTDLFNGCTGLVNCGTLNFQGINYANRTFQSCTALKEIRITGDIGTSVSFADSSLLTTESVNSIINALKDLKGATTQTLTFHAIVVEKLNDEQKATITAKNWTLVY